MRLFIKFTYIKLYTVCLKSSHYVSVSHITSSNAGYFFDILILDSTQLRAKACVYAYNRKPHIALKRCMTHQSTAFLHATQNKLKILSWLEILKISIFSLHIIIRVDNATGTDVFLSYDIFPKDIADAATISNIEIWDTCTNKIFLNAPLPPFSILLYRP